MKSDITEHDKLNHCIFLGSYAGKNITEGSYEFRVTVGCPKVIGTKLTHGEWEVIDRVISRCVEKGDE